MSFRETDRRNAMERPTILLGSLTMSIRLHFLGVASSVLLVCARASAREVAEENGNAVAETVQGRRSSGDEKFPLPDQGHLLITSGAQFSIMHLVSSDSFGTTQRTTNISLTPSFDYLVTDHLTVGTRLSLGIAKSDNWGSTLSLGVSPFVGYLIPLGERLAIWPKVGASYTYYDLEFGGTSHSIG